MEEVEEEVILMLTSVELINIVVLDVWITAHISDLFYFHVSVGLVC